MRAWAKRQQAPQAQQAQHEAVELAAELSTEASLVPEQAAGETDETAPWPQAGEKVAVGVEHLMHALRVGETGISQGAAPDPSEVIVKLDIAAVLAPLSIPRSHLVPLGKPMRTLRLWDKCSES